MSYNIPLSDQDHRDSLPYVCYERSLFHLVKMKWGLRAFEWLYADRYLGFDHVDSSEALHYQQDGLNAWIGAHSVGLRAEPGPAVEATRDLLSAGWGVRVMADTTRPDGSHYLTSTVIDEVTGDVAVITKTNAADRVTRKPVEVAEFFGRIPVGTDGCIELDALRSPCGWIEDLNARAGLGLFHAIVVDGFGYGLDGGLVRSGMQRRPSSDGFDAFVESVIGRAAEFASDGIPVAWRLRLNKHVADKVAPVTQAWRFMCGDPEVAAHLGDVGTDVTAAGAVCDQGLERLGQAFSFAACRPGSSTIKNLISAIEHTAADYRRFQDCTHEATCALIGADA